MTRDDESTRSRRDWTSGAARADAPRHYDDATLLYARLHWAQCFGEWSAVDWIWGGTDALDLLG